ncbi:MAG TPA: GDP-mannose 4,6-dehydratase [Gemmatimonadales bacterium]|jgi:GDP-4-dehydro-6-deoxy-D-mannose reductase|nr:GDP-mannose 4,6-dehydratase [Gemmatimonadales bacterium]
MRILITGADGFVGRYLLRHLLRSGHELAGAVRHGSDAARGWLTDAEYRAVRWVRLELEDQASVGQLFGTPVDAVVHLAAVASGSEARQDPGHAWVVNAAGTARLLEAAASAREAGTADPLVLVISSAEVYGPGQGRRVEDAPMLPVSPYAASKAGAELSAAEVGRRTGLRIMVARPFQHTGPGQTDRYVVPVFARRLRAAKVGGLRQVPVGNLAPVRDISDVRDVVAAYAALLERGAPGEIYNVCRGDGVSLGELFRKLSALVGVDAEPVPDPALARPADIAHLIGDNTRLRAATGWSPSISLDQTLKDVVDAQAD